MRKLLLVSALMIPALLPVSSRAQTDAKYGTITVKTASATKDGLLGKRIYVFKGGLKDNEELVKRIKETESLSSDCFYAGLQPAVSPAFLSWIHAQKYCSTPLCGRIVEADVKGDKAVKEFADAYTANMKMAVYKGRDKLALDWLVNSLPPSLTYGFYTQQKKTLGTIFGGVEPVTSGLIGEKSPAEATLVDLPLTGDKATFTVSNILPAEIKKKGYIWIQEVEVKDGKATVTLSIKEDTFKRDVKVCSAGA